MNLLNCLWFWLRDESGQDTVDYALFSLVVALATVAAVHGVATNVDHALTRVDHLLTAAVASCLRHHTGAGS